MARKKQRRRTSFVNERPPTMHLLTPICKSLSFFISSIYALISISIPISDLVTEICLKLKFVIIRDEDALLNTQCPRNLELRWQTEVSSSIYATPLIADINR